MALNISNRVTMTPARVHKNLYIANPTKNKDIGKRTDKQNGLISGINQEKKWLIVLAF